MELMWYREGQNEPSAVSPLPDGWLSWVVDLSAGCTRRHWGTIDPYRDRVLRAVDAAVFLQELLNIQCDVVDAARSDCIKRAGRLPKDSTVRERLLEDMVSRQRESDPLWAALDEAIACFRQLQHEGGRLVISGD